MSRSARQWWMLGGACCLVALLLLWVSSRTPTSNDSSEGRPPTPSSESPSKTRVGGALHRTTPGEVEPASSDAKPEEKSADPLRMITIRRGQVLAIVNGINITLADLVPLSKDDPFPDRSMTEEMFHARLAEAIDRELTFQAAAAQRVSLTPVQQKQLDQIRGHYDEMNSRPGVKKTYITDEQIAFEVRTSTARLLQANLLEQHMKVTPLVTPDQVEEYYLKHKSEYGELPLDPEERDAAWLRIDFAIRQQLAPLQQEEFFQQRRSYLDKLRSSATITINQPS